MKEDQNGEGGIFIYIHQIQKGTIDTLEEQLKKKWDNFYNYIDSYVGDRSDETKNIAVIGITDYLSIDNYKKVITDDRLPKSIFVLPNVEMRIMPTGEEAPVNIHFIFNPEIVDELEERFFSQIKFEHVDRQYSASRQGLLAFGKCFDNSLSDELAYKKGIEKFVPTYADTNKVFNNDKKLKENTLIGVANSSTDGASGIIRGEGGDQLTGVREAVYRISDFIFSSNDNDIKYFLGKKVDSPEVVKEKYGSVKPCFHGSDAHKLNKLFEPDAARYCWVKADASFNGLRQVIYEPEARVRIAATKPEEKSDYQVIDRVEITDDELSQEPILLNDKLTCIIGGKSTGKSLLLQNMARAIDSRQVEEKISTSGASTKKVEEISVIWRDGEKSESGQLDNTHKIVYIPQTYLNRLTDNKEETTEIDKIIQDVILMDSECNEAYEQMNQKIKQFRPELDKRIYDLIATNNNMKELLNKRAEIGSPEGIKKEIEKLKKQKDEISQKLSISEEDIERYDLANKNISEINTEIDALNIDTQIINSMNEILIPTEIEPGLSDNFKNKIIEFQDEVLHDYLEKWNNKREEIFKEINEKKQICTKKLQESIKIRDELDIKIHENETLSRLTILIVKVNRMNILMVALGGALGAVCRYGISRVPFEANFPIATFITNLIGAFVIGFIAGTSEKNNVSEKMVLFFKTGFCGGFTTFSTFSLEAMTLLNGGKYLTGGAYMVLSLILCVAGVAFGQQCARRLI